MLQVRSRRAGVAALTAMLPAVLLAVLLAMGLLLMGVGPALAAPSDDDVDRARAAVEDAASSVAEIEIQLAQHAATLDQAWTVVAAAGEDYTEALVAQQAAEQAAADATERHAVAQVEMAGARQELGTIALQAYRSGGAMDSLGALLSADGFEDLVARTTALDRLGVQADRAVQRFRAADLVTRTLAGRAEDAAGEAEEAATTAEDLLAAAEAAQRTAEEEVARATAERERLIADLAVARQTSVEVERARQDALDAERAARAEAAAAAERGVTPSTPATQPTATPATPATPTTPATPAIPSTPAPTSPPPATPTPATPPSTPAPTPTPTPSPEPEPAPEAHGLGTGTSRGSAAQGQAAVAWAVQQVGKPYGWGTTGPDAFDCSGLTSQAYRAAGVSIPRTSRDQYRAGLKIAYASMRPGDLIAWGGNPDDPGSITHIAMYVGGGQMVEAARPGVPVRVTTVRWSGTMPYAVRP